MKLLEKYLFNTLSQTFFPIFWTLFIITSIIFLIKIAALTSIIQMNFIELLELYSYSLPTILFYILPISYFIGIVLTMAKFSADYEVIIFSSFGLNPLKFIQKLLPFSIAISIILLILSLGLLPKANYMKAQFMYVKKQEARFNIKASEYGQQFGSWLIYVNEEKDDIFKNITLLQVEKNKDLLISANQAQLNNNKSLLRLRLKDGKSFSIGDDIQQVDFNIMELNNDIKEMKNIKSLHDIFIYWKDRETDRKKSKAFSFNILISIFPILSLFFILWLGYFNPRYDKNRATAFSTILLVIFIVIANKFSAIYPNAILYTLPTGWFIFSYLSYYFTARKLY